MTGQEFLEAAYKETELVSKEELRYAVLVREERAKEVTPWISLITP